MKFLLVTYCLGLTILGATYTCVSGQSELPGNTTLQPSEDNSTSATPANSTEITPTLLPSPTPTPTHRPSHRPPHHCHPHHGHHHHGHHRREHEHHHHHHGHHHHGFPGGIPIPIPGGIDIQF
ncbi:histidine-rich glycoprotein-like [Leptopilina heterotoma]|uniref:histidine-rich glycoprotein-like n=1 Tax=Leptopilina heterotoma TaxID=63436 RepID=UPI001CA7CA4B|nr:histidine-rich glycoprotein-like [Leptopilina heterotoma]